MKIDDYIFKKKNPFLNRNITILGINLIDKNLKKINSIVVGYIIMLNIIR